MSTDYFANVQCIVGEIVVKHMCKYFIQRWNAKYPSLEWKSNSESGMDLVTEIPEESKKTEEFLKCKEKLQLGNEKDWDIMLLEYIMLESGLELCDQSAQKSIKLLKERVMSIYTDAPDVLRTNSELEQTMKDIQMSVSAIFGKDAEDQLSKALEEKCGIPTVGDQSILYTKAKMGEESEETAVVHKKSCSGRSHNNTVAFYFKLTFVSTNIC